MQMQMQSNDDHEDKMKCYMCMRYIEILPEGTTYYQNEFRVICEPCFSSYEYDQYHIDMMMMRCRATPEMRKVYGKSVFYNHTTDDDRINIHDFHDYMSYVRKNIDYYEKRIFDGFDDDVFKSLHPLQQEYINDGPKESIVDWNRRHDNRNYKSMQPIESLLVWDILEIYHEEKMFWNSVTGILINRVNNEQVAILYADAHQVSITIMFNTFEEYKRARRSWEQLEHIPDSDANLELRNGVCNWTSDELKFLMSRANFAMYCVLLISELD